MDNAEPSLTVWQSRAGLDAPPDFQDDDGLKRAPPYLFGGADLRLLFQLSAYCVFLKGRDIETIW